MRRSFSQQERKLFFGDSYFNLTFFFSDFNSDIKDVICKKILVLSLITNR